MLCHKEVCIEIDIEQGCDEMYITIKSIKKTLGKYIEMSDLYIGLPMLMVFLTMFAFTNLKIEAIIFLPICVFLLIPINVSKKNRMYKVLILFFTYLFKNKNYCFFNKEQKESKVKFISDILKK